eukprot:XP_003976487.1 PREDICTED: neuropilin and tolloid-like protein 1 [Takifugu rubripes]
MVPKLLLLSALAAVLVPPEPSAAATKTKAQVKNNSGVTPAGQCGTWVKEPDGGYFTSPNYPEKYPPERECVYIIEASPRQCIDLFFDDKYSIEPSWECKFDHIEVRDGPFGFSPLIGRYCGQESPAYVHSSGRYLYIKFVADSELEATGFSARYNFTQEKRKHSILESLDHTNLTIIGVTCGLVLILLIISVIIQLKQPRKKYIIRREDFDPALLHSGVEPPHYELCALRRAPSGDLADAALAEDFEKFHKLRRSSSRCIRDHHCGSQQGSVHGSIHGSRSNLSMRDATIPADGGAAVALSQQSPRLPQHTAPAGRRSVVVMKHSYSQDDLISSMLN